MKLLDVSEINETASKYYEETKKLVEGSGDAKDTKLFGYDFIYRMKLDVTVNAPILIVPESSKSHKGLLLDLGDLALVSNYEIQKDYYQNKQNSDDQQPVVRRLKLAPILEMHTVSFKNMQMLK